MNKINNRIAQIHTELSKIIGDCLEFDLSADQIKQIQDKKYDIVKQLFALQDTIRSMTSE